MSPKPRACGTCNACCVALDVAEYDKPAHVPCPHLSKTGKGCGNYASRKPVCGAFECTWLTGGIPAEMRPDRTGIIVWGPRDLSAQAGETVVAVNECAPRALSKPENLRFLREVSQSMVVLVTPMNGVQSVFGPDAKARKVRLAIVRDEPEVVACEVVSVEEVETPAHLLSAEAS